MRYSRSRIGAALIAAVVGFVMTGCEEVARKPEVPPRDEQPPETVPDDKPIRLHDTVHVITEQQLGEIQMVDAASISFRTQVEYSPGDVIAVGLSDQTPYGLLRKVAAVSSDRLTVMTDAATIEDVIKQGTVKISGTLTPDDLTPENRAELVQDGILADREGLRSAAEGNRSFNYPLSYTDGSVTVSGNLQLRIGYELEARYDDGLKDISFSITPSPSVTAEVTAMGSFTVTRQVGRTLKFAPIPIPSTPIYFTPELELYLGAAGNIKASVSARYTVSATVGAECEEACDQSDNWNSLSSVNQSQLDMVNFDTATEGQIEGQFSVFVEPKLTFNVFGGLGGPHVKARPYIRATATAKAGSSDNACFLATLETGADGAFGAQLSVWGASLTLDDLSFILLDPEVLWEDEVGECDPEPDPEPDPDPDPDPDPEPDPEPGDSCNDAATLLSIKDELRGTGTLNWSATLPFGQWQGVGWQDGCVTSLYLYNNQLTGSIPDSLGNLANLTRLDLDHNQLTGSIPDSLGNLANLTRLDLDNNQLTGSIPDSLGNLANLTYLDLDHNQLTGSIPDSLGNLANLESLDLDRNQLTGSIPDSLGNLANLESLDLDRNQLTGSIPDSLGNLANLESLNLDTNQLTGSIPDSLGNLANLTDLYLDNNQLTGSIPDSLGNLANLTDLYLYNNQLTGSIPDSLGNLANLTDLYLYNNQLTGSIPDSLGNLANLTRLYLDNNQLTGSIPDSLGNLANLEGLYLDNNQLTGSIPDSLGNLANLTHLYLDNNQLTGSIPDSLGNLANLTRLYLDNNQLTGSIPDSLGNLANLTRLDLYNNQLTGSIPDSLGNLANLTHLDLGSNNLTGCVPTTLSRFSSVYSNETEDTLPECGDTTQLGFVSLTVADQTYTENTSIPPLTLPQATGGNAPLAYRLTPVVPGLTFDVALRRLSGTPTSTGTYSMTYTATDADGDTDSLTFTITVNPSVGNRRW